MTALAIIHVAKKQLGLDEDTYRAMLMRETGKNSAAKLTANEQRRVIEVLRNQGFKPASSAPKKGLKGKYAKKLQALWIGAWNLGIVRDRRDAALIAFVTRQTGLDHVRFLHHSEDARRAIEGLKAWMTREAGVDWTVHRFRPEWTQIDAARIAVAQFGILKATRPSFTDAASLRAWIIAETGQHPEFISSADWIATMNRLGKLVREMSS